MAAVSSFQALVFVITASSLVAVSDGWCSSCDLNEVCCHNECIFASDCLGEYCSIDNDCSSDQSCCNGYCRSDCFGLSCSTDSDCGSNGFENCCYGSCSYEVNCDVHEPTAAILGSVFGAMLFICMVSLCIFFARRQRGTIVRPDRVIVRQRITTTVTAAQANQPYRGQMPPSYQQVYPYYPPPKYEQHQTAISEQPPPYSAATQGRSGGVYAPQTSYGAVTPAPSAPSI